VISIAPNTTCFTIDLLLGFFALVSSIVPIDGIFEIVRVVRSGLVSIAEVHAIIAGAHHAKSEPEMARDRFGFLERHDASKALSRRAVRWRIRSLVALLPGHDLLPCAKHLFVTAIVGGLRHDLVNEGAEKGSASLLLFVPTFGAGVVSLQLMK